VSKIPSYSYICHQCNKEKTITCRMSEYTSTIPCECNNEMVRKPDDLVCGMSIDKTNSFFRSVN
jgi:predicted nucleic acid-binding Zn ribbon protein